MRTIAIVLNVIMFVIFVPFIAHEPLGQFSKDPLSFCARMLVCVTPIFAVWTLAFVPNSASWLYLYIKRKSSKERKRIAELKGDTDRFAWHKRQDRPATPDETQQIRTQTHCPGPFRINSDAITPPTGTQAPPKRPSTKIAT